MISLQFVKSLFLVAQPIALVAALHGTSIANTAPSSDDGIDQQAILANAPKLPAEALEYAVNGYDWALAQGKVDNDDVLTVIDFELPSNQKRLWVIDLKSNKVLMNAYASHGSGSGVTYAEQFSNKMNSHETSLGVYKTLDTYYGHHGKSLRLQGLEKGINNNAYKRAIVVHPASYVTPSFVKQNHRAGRSWGCFALNPAISKKFMNITKGGSIIFAYADEEKDDDYIA